MADISLQDLMVALPFMKYTREGQQFMDNIILDELFKDDEDEKSKEVKKTAKGEGSTERPDDEYIDVVQDEPEAPPTVVRQKPPRTPVKVQKRKSHQPMKFTIENNARSLVLEQQKKQKKNNELKKHLENKTSSMPLPAPVPVYPTKTANPVKTSEQPVEEDNIVNYMFNTISDLIEKYPKLAKSKKLEALVRQVLSARTPSHPRNAVVAGSPNPFSDANSHLPGTSASSSGSMPLFPNLSDLPGTSAGSFAVNGELEARQSNPVLYEQIMNIVAERNRV